MVHIIYQNDCIDDSLIFLSGAKFISWPTNQKCAKNEAGSSLHSIALFSHFSFLLFFLFSFGVFPFLIFLSFSYFLFFYLLFLSFRFPSFFSFSSSSFLDWLLHWLELHFICLFFISSSSSFFSSSLSFLLLLLSIHFLFFYWSSARFSKFAAAELFKGEVHVFV